MRIARPVLLLALLAGLVPVPAGAEQFATASRWAPLSRATIRPGATTITAGNQCTANFVFVGGDHVYLGQAAHCAATGPANETDGCEAEVLPLGTRVRVGGARSRGTLVYSSWVTMQRRGERNAELCASNDFALIRLAPADARRVNPTVPHWGGPTGLARTASVGDRVFSYGRSGLWLGTDQLHPHRGIVVSRTRNRRGFQVATAPPGIPGDSGSPYLDPSGRALGVLSTLEVAPVPGSNHLAGLGKALDYLHRTTSLRVRLALGTAPFRAEP